MSCQELGDTLSTTPQCILSMFIHKKQSATPSKHFRDGCVTVHVCVYQMEKRPGPMLTHLKIFMKSQVIQEMYSVDLRVFQEHISTCTNRRQMQTNIKNPLALITLGFFLDSMHLQTEGEKCVKCLGPSHE